MKWSMQATIPPKPRTKLKGVKGKEDLLDQWKKRYAKLRDASSRSEEIIRSIATHREQWAADRSEALAEISKLTNGG